MAYQVIARKWRPKDFADLVGQDHISQTLLNAIRHNRLHHALLFTGPRGTGKTSSARILAKALRCPNSVDFVPCHKCAECQEIATSRSLNVIEIDGASNNGVDAIRELRETVGYMPSSGKYKLYIIDEVHMLSTSAFNALLKTLEEPPPHVIFVLATTDMHKIPETVLSRVQRFDFRCIPTKLIAKHLETICKNENVTASNEALWLIARQGAGSMRDSQSFLDQAMTFSSDNLTLEKVIEILGLTDRRVLIESLSALVNHDQAATLRIIEKIATAGYEPKIFLQDLLEEIRHLLMVKILGAKADTVVDLPDSELANLTEAGQKLSEEDIHLLFDMALKGSQDIFRAPDPRMALDMVLLRMAAAPRVVDILQSLSATPTAQVAVPRSIAAVSAANVAPMPNSPRSSVPPTPVAEPTPPLEASSTSESWFQLVKKIIAVNSVIGTQLENCFLIELKDKRISLGVPPKMKFLFEKLNAPEFKKKVLNYVTTFWGPGFSIEVQTAEPAGSGAMTPKAIATQQEDASQQKLRQQIEEHPIVKSTLSVFKSEIRSIKEI